MPPPAQQRPACKKLVALAASGHSVRDSSIQQDTADSSTGQQQPFVHEPQTPACTHQQQTQVHAPPTPACTQQQQPAPTETVTVNSSTSSSANSGLDPACIFLAATNSPPQQRLFLRGKVNGVQMTALIDSGSEQDFISKEFCQQQGLAVTAASTGECITVQFPDGERRRSDATVVATVRLSNFKFQHRLHVLDITGYDVILGIPWLRQYNPDVDWSTHTVRLVHKSTQIVLHSTVGALAACATAEVQPDTDTADPAAHIFGPNANWQQELQALLDGYNDVFQEPTALPPERPIQHRIDIIPGAKIPYQRIYRLSPAQKEESKRQVATLLGKGYIRPSVSPYACGVLFVPKPNGTFRMCTDYRPVNAISIKDRFPLPLIDDLLDQVQGCNTFTKLDLFSGFHQVRMAEEDIPKTAFRTDQGHFEYVVLPFGLTNAPATFQRLMNYVLRDYIGTFVAVYMDDILIHSKSPEEHLDHLQQVLAKLREHNLFCNLSKCAFGKNKIGYLGYIISADGLSVDPSKTSTVDNWPTPTPAADVASFLGLAGYYRRFVHKFAERAAPLHALTHKDAPFDWTTTCAQAFRDLKTALTTAPVLVLADPSKPYSVYADASGKAIAAVLTQDGKPVSFYSRKLTPSEQNYTTGEQELLAIVASLSEWRCYLQGAEFLVNSDHLNHKTLQTKQFPSKREIRWLEFLQQFDYRIQHVPGKKNPADPLSRRPDYMAALATAPDLPSDGLLSQVKEGYAADNDYVDADFNSRLQQQDGLWYYHDRLAVPSDPSLRAMIIAELHDSPTAGHLGTDKTLAAVSRRFWWPRMSQTVRDYLRRCHSCQVSKPVNQKPYGLLQPLPTPSANWEQVTTDMITDLPPTQRGYDSIAVFVDRLSKMVHFAPTTKQVTSAGYARLLLDNVIRLHGFPRVIISDRDPRFTSRFYNTLFDLCGTKLKFSTAYHPQTDGQSERTNRTLEEVLRAYTSPRQDDWDLHLSTAEFALNNTVSPSIGTTRSTPTTATIQLPPLIWLHRHM